MKKIISLAIVLIAAVGAYAQENDDRTVDVTLKSGEVSSFNVSDIESVTFRTGWTSLGICEYTEDFLATHYLMSEQGDMVVTYEVEIQEKDDTPGLYRLVDPYGIAYPFNQYGTIYYDDSWVFYMEVNACDPDGVYIERQMTNFMGTYPYSPWDLGQLWVSSYAWEYFLSFGVDLETVKRQPDMVGTLKNGVITFPQYATTCLFPDKSYDWYYGNWDDAFKIVLPSARTKAPETKKDEGVDLSTVAVKTAAHIAPAEVSE